MTDYTVAIDTALQADVTLLAPLRVPTVPDEPIVLTILGAIAHNRHCMISLLGAAIRSQDATLITLPAASGIETNDKRPVLRDICRNVGFICAKVLVVHNVECFRRFFTFIASTGLATTAGVRIVLLGCESIVLHHPLEDTIWPTSLAALVGACVVLEVVA